MVFGTTTRFGPGLDLAPSALHGFTNNCFHWAGFALLTYEHLCTLPEEIVFIWSRPKAIPSIVFLATRYITFVGYFAIVFFMTTGGMSKQNCTRWSTFGQALLVLSQVLVYVLAGMRAYALWMRSKRILVLVIGAALFTGAVNLWALVDNSGGTVVRTETAFFGCQTVIPQDLANHLVVPWESVFALDVLIVVLTLSGTIFNSSSHARRESIMSGTERLSLPTLLLRDGILYFALIATINLANVILFYVGNPVSKGGLSSFASSVSVTMITRLMLNLHRSAPSQAPSSTRTGSESKTSKLMLTTFVTEDSAGSPTGSEFCYDEWVKAGELA